MTGTSIVHRDDFKRVGGFDVRFRGWGDEDIDLYDALRFHGVTEHRFSANLLRHIEHPVAMRVALTQTSDHHLSLLVNRMYRQLKWDLARLRAQPLADDECSALFERVSQTVAQKLDAGNDGELTFDVGEWCPAGLAARRELRFHSAAN